GNHIHLPHLAIYALEMTKKIVKARGYMRYRQPEDSRGVSAARLLPFAILLLCLAGWCGQYGISWYQTYGLGTAWTTLALAGLLLLTAIGMIILCIQSFREGRQATTEIQSKRTKRR